MPMARKLPKNNTEFCQGESNFPVKAGEIIDIAETAIGIAKT